MIGSVQQKGWDGGIHSSPHGDRKVSGRVSDQFTGFREGCLFCINIRAQVTLLLYFAAVQSVIKMHKRPHNSQWLQGKWDTIR